MNAQIDKLLRQYHEQFTKEHDRRREDLLSELPHVVASPQSAASTKKKRLVRSFIGSATCAAVGILFWLIFLSGPQTLSAQILQAIKNAQSVHLVRKLWKDGQWLPSGEVWYQHGQGVREQLKRGDKKFIRIDNGVHQWQYDSGTNIAVRKKSADPLGLAAEAIDPGKILNRCERDPEGDTEIQGRKCRLFAAVNETQTQRIMVWLDEENRLLRYKEQILKGGQWIEDEWIEAHYDVPVEAACFQPNFGAGIKIVESDKFLDERFNLKNAIFTQEIEGHVLALHRLQKINDRMFFLVYSTRPTENTLRKFGKPLGSMSYADFNLYTPGKRVENDKWQSLQAVDLAKMHLEGMIIDWSIVILQGEWPEKIEAFDFGGRFYTRGPLQEELGKQNKSAYLDFRPLATLPLSPENISLDDMLASVYQETSLCLPVAFQINLYLQSRPLSEDEIQGNIKHGMPEGEARKLFRRLGSTPNKISQQEFGAAIKEYISQFSDAPKGQK
jgi:hypothetical protein